MDGFRQYLPLVGWISALVVGIVAFTAMGDGPLSPPPLTEPSSWGDWLALREPLVASIALLRLVVLALAWYLVGVTTVSVVARLSRAAALIQVADALSVPTVRRVVQGAMGIGLATTMAASVAVPVRPLDTTTSGSTGEASATQTVVEGDGAAADPVGAGGPDASVRSASMERVDGATEAMRRVDAPQTEHMTLVAAEAAPDRHEVGPGEHLWGIAEQHLADVLDRQPDEDETLGYWQRLIEHNRDRLTDPDNPDLVYPGQMFELPDVGSQV